MICFAESAGDISADFATIGETFTVAAVVAWTTLASTIEVRIRSGSFRGRRPLLSIALRVSAGAGIHVHFDVHQIGVDSIHCGRSGPEQGHSMNSGSKRGFFALDYGTNTVFRWIDAAACGPKELT